MYSSGTVITCDDGHDHYISLASISGLPPPSTYTDEKEGNGGGDGQCLPPVAEEHLKNSPHEIKGGIPFAQTGLTGADDLLRGTQLPDSSEQVYYLTCLKCKEWEELQAVSIETMSRLKVRR